MVPFLNARLQGLDVLWRGSTDFGVTGFDAQQRKKRFMFRMLSLRKKPFPKQGKN